MGYPSKIDKVAAAFVKFLEDRSTLGSSRPEGNPDGLRWGVAQWEVVRHSFSIYFDRAGDRIVLRFEWPGGTRTATLDPEDLERVAVGIPLALLAEGVGLVIHPVAGWIVFDLEDPFDGDRTAMVRANEYWEALRILRPPRRED